VTTVRLMLSVFLILKFCGLNPLPVTSQPWSVMLYRVKTLVTVEFACLKFNTYSTP
jgi:hypothetical protein